MVACTAPSDRVSLSPLCSSAEPRSVGDPSRIRGSVAASERVARPSLSVERPGHPAAAGRDPAGASGPRCERRLARGPARGSSSRAAPPGSPRTARRWSARADPVRMPASSRRSAGPPKRAWSVSTRPAQANDGTRRSFAYAVDATGTCVVGETTSPNAPQFEEADRLEERRVHARRLPAGRQAGR